MKVQVSALVIALLIGPAQAFAADNYFITIEGNPQIILTSLSGYPGRCWGIAIDRIFLAGGAEEIDWLRRYDIDFRFENLDQEASYVYISFIDPASATIPAGEIIDTGPGYIITLKPAERAVSCRRLTMKPLPNLNIAGRPSDYILDYDADIDSLIGRVSQDSILAFLNRFSGNAPVDVNGGIDTIKTRFSGTHDNRTAAQYLKETFENYGYQTEYHGFYGGTLRHVATYDQNRAWAVTEGSEALRTTDGGISWQAIPDNSSSELWGVENIGPDSVWISGNYGTLRFSSDGGSSFVNQTPSVGGFLFGIDFINSSEGWIAADQGWVLHTTNAGQTWTAHESGTFSRLYDVCFADSQNGWVVGRDGTISHTTNGGANWTRQTSHTIERLYSVDFIDTDYGWVVGWGGVVLHTTDGGANWTAVDIGSSVEKYHVDFADASHGCIAGWNGEIFVTFDGGTNWEQVSSGTTNDFYGLDFSDSLNGFAVGNGIIAKTSDGGWSWNNQTGGVESSWLNVVATKPGTTDPGQQVIMCAHMDNTSEQPQMRAPGSDDNGSGTTGIIEAARIFQNVSFEKTIKFCLWTGEEQGLLGSAAYAADAAGRGDTIIGVFNYDMIAWDGNSDGSIELHCGNMPSSQDLGHLFEDIISDYQIALQPEFLTWNSTDRSDHASFWDHNYPAMLGIEDFSSDFNPYYHTTNDNMQFVDESMFTLFVKAGIGAAATLAIIDTSAVLIEESEELPDAFTLRQNYPNPFNAATTISFSLAEKSQIHLVIYDVMGRIVATLYNGEAGPGNHAITWNAGGYSSGIYFYRLQAGSNDAVYRMSLLK